MGRLLSASLFAVVSIWLIPRTSGIAGQPPSPGELAVLAAGCVYKHAHLPATEGEWWVLCAEGTKAVVRQTTLSQRPAQGEGLQNSAVEITSPDCSVANVILLFRGVAAARRGPVDTVALRRSLYEWPLRTQGTPLKLGSNVYELTTEWGTVRKGGEDQMPPYKVILSVGATQQQVLAEMKQTNDAGPHLDWAGDLDRDGRLDLVLQTPTHYVMADSDVYLSSLAMDGRIVRKIGTIERCGGD